MSAVRRPHIRRRRPFTPMPIRAISIAPIPASASETVRRSAALRSLFACGPATDISSRSRSVPARRRLKSAGRSARPPPPRFIPAAASRGAYSQDGKRYADMPNAFAYRDKVVSNCSCNGKTPFGLANLDVKSDPTLRPGDIVATYDGLAQAARRAPWRGRIHADQQIRADGRQAAVRIEGRAARAMAILD